MWALPIIILILPVDNYSFLQMKCIRRAYQVMLKGRPKIISEDLLYIWKSRNYLSLICSYIIQEWHGGINDL